MNNIHEMNIKDVDLIYDCLTYAKLHPEKFRFWHSTMDNESYWFYDENLKEYLYYVGCYNQLFIEDFDGVPLSLNDTGYAVVEENELHNVKIKTLYDCMITAIKNPKKFLFWNSSTEYGHHIYYDDILEKFILFEDETEKIQVMIFDNEFDLMSTDIQYTTKQ